MTKKQRAENRLIDELAKRKIITSYQGSLEQFAVDNFKAGYAAAPAYEKQLSVSDFFNSIRELLDEARDWWHRQCSADKNKELLEKYYHEGELLSDEKIINMFLMEEKREFAAAPAYKGYENLETKAAIFLEEMHISGDTMVAMDHSLDDVPEEEQGSLYLHDIMSLFVESLTPTQPNSVQEGEKEAVEGWIREKPEIKNDCLLLVGAWINNCWDVEIFEIVKTDGEDEDGNPAWYWGVFNDGCEWGDFDDISGKLYKIVEYPAPPQQ